MCESKKVLYTATIIFLWEEQPEAKDGGRREECFAIVSVESRVTGSLLLVGRAEFCGRGYYDVAPVTV